MATGIIGRNFDVTPDIRELVTKKLTKVSERLFDDVIETRVVLQVEKYRNICEILVVGKDHDVKTIQESDESMQDAINAAIDHLKRQAQKNRKKIRDHHRKDGNGRKSEVNEWAVQVLEPGNLREAGDQNRPRIIKTNNLPIRPMSIEEAALRLDDSKNEFIVFRDLDTDKISVIYKRRDNNIGLIAPEI
ncbi:MAG TPA: ribosome-associated translation inhibitor RaiA [Thermoanaerobaculia bacterium]|nr:ribosome-associated translation inhibitor RaiA [Thermoanaerobaculia bacterium]